MAEIKVRLNMSNLHRKIIAVGKTLRANLKPSSAFYRQPQMRISSENHALSAPLPRFMCDVMLARLARYLRAAGYDTAVAADAAADRDIIRQAAEEGRWLLTMDRKIQDHKAARGLLVVLAHAELDAQARELGGRFAMDWAGHAFSRC
ncbi:MAG: Mut7-C RNAse domain-containing protein, partial [Sulfuricella sp.]